MEFRTGCSWELMYPKDLVLMVDLLVELRVRKWRIESRNERFISTLSRTVAETAFSNTLSRGSRNTKRKINKSRC